MVCSQFCAGIGLFIAFIGLPNAGIVVDDGASLVNLSSCHVFCGTSTVTTFVESSAGVAEGGRTGLSSMATAVLFFIAMFLAPVAQLIPTYACAAALIYVGVLMMSNVRTIDWDDPAAAVPGFMTVAFMPLTYNISYGIAFGLISYVFIKIFTGKIKEINVGTWVITILFALMFFLTR